LTSLERAHEHKLAILTLLDCTTRWGLLGFSLPSRDDRHWMFCLFIQCILRSSFSKFLKSGATHCPLRDEAECDELVNGIGGAMPTQDVNIISQQLGCMFIL
jgi:hypothetical protein